MPDISIVTISFNQAMFLKDCINSVLNQDVDVEYIIVDPGSADGSRDIIRSYGDAVNAIFEKDGGPADGLNKGFAQASAPILGFINSDDVLEPSALNIVVEYFKQNPKLDIVTGSGVFIDADGRSLRSILPTPFLPWLYAYGAVTVFQQGTFFRRRAFDAVGGFNVENKTCWDGELFLDMCMAGAKSSIIPAKLACFRLHAASITCSNRLAVLYEQDGRRLFRKAIGRDRIAFDRIFRIIALAIKYFGSPKYLQMRLQLWWMERGR